MRNAQYALEQADCRDGRRAQGLRHGATHIRYHEEGTGIGGGIELSDPRWRDLSLAELDLVGAMTVHGRRPKSNLVDTTGATLEHNGIKIQDALNGTVSTASP